MMNIRNNPPSRLRTLLGLVVAGLALASVGGCAYSSAPPEHANAKFPIQVAREQVSLSIAIPEAGDALSPDDARRLQTFLNQFVQRGRTLMTVETTLPDRARAVLTASGLRARELVFMSDTTTPAPYAALSFTANTAQVPDCSNWSENTAFSPMNEPYPDWGCSARRNLGLTVSDPGDLIQSQPMSGGSAVRREAAMETYKTGAKVGTAGESATSKISGATAK